MLRQSLSVLFLIFSTLSVQAKADIFEVNEGIWRNSPQLIQNDKGLLCLGYDKNVCDKSYFRVLTATGSTNGIFLYELEYSIVRVTCKAMIQKNYIPELGWATMKMMSGMDCQEVQ